MVQGRLAMRFLKRKQQKPIWKRMNMLPWPMTRPLEQLRAEEKVKMTRIQLSRCEFLLSVIRKDDTEIDGETGQVLHRGAAI